jgi:hypothetical protein
VAVPTPARPIAAATAPVSITRDQVDQVRLARWQAWDRQAAELDDGYLLSVELLHSRPDHALAVFTVVRGHHAVQSVVTAGLPPAAALAPDDVASPDGMALGEPPPKEPPPPGIVAQGTTLLDAAFDGIATMAMAVGDPPVKQPPTPGAVVAPRSPNPPPR